MSSPAPLNSMVHQHNSFLISILDSFATFSFRHICLASLTMFTVKGKCWPHIRITGGGFLKIQMPKWHPWPVKWESLDVCAGINCSLPCPGDTNDPQVIPVIPALKPPVPHLEPLSPPFLPSSLMGVEWVFWWEWQSRRRPSSFVSLQLPPCSTKREGAWQQQDAWRIFQLLAQKPKSKPKVLLF